MLVIGSGPSGVAAASALLDRGYDVTMIDPGIELEPERRAVIASMSSRPSEAWTPAEIASVKHGFNADLGGVAEKLVYGSGFPYRTPGLLDDEAAPFAGSYAIGGLSNAWGAGVMPLARDEMAGWPITREQLDPHYRAAANILGIAGVHDRLESAHPLYTDDAVQLPLSRQAGALLTDLEREAGTMERAGLRFGRSRLAVAGSNPSGFGCASCGLCLYGCPYGLIYTAATTVGKLGDRRGFRHEPGWIVQRLDERNGSVFVHARSTRDDRERVFEADRAFLATGVLPTARIMLDSLEVDGPVVLRDSQYFLIPVLRTKGIRGVRQERLHTLAQVFIQIASNDDVPGGAHLSLYTYNDAYETVLRARAGPVFPLLKPLLPALLGRLLIAQGFLHSDASGTVDCFLSTKSGRTVLSTRPRSNPRSTTTVRSIVRLVRRHRRAFKARPISPLVSIASPGRGYHAGASFPMRAAPKEQFDTDTLGRVGRYERVHIVDTSVLPSIPGTSITFTVMANAHRIASEV